VSDDREGPFEAQDDEEEEATPEAPSAVDLKSQRRIRDKAKREAEEARLFWKSVFATPVGRREVWAILANLRTFDNNRFANGPNGFPQESATWYYRGEQDAGFRIFRSLEKIDMSGFALMRKEHDPFLSEPPKRRRRDPEDAWR